MDLGVSSLPLFADDDGAEDKQRRSAQSVLFWIRLTSATFLLQIGCSWPLWLSHETVLPGTPIIALLARLDPILIIVCILPLAGLWFAETATGRKAFVTWAIVAYAMLVGADLSRLQPWALQHLLMLGSLAWYPQNAELRFRIILSAMYFWSGVHKLNDEFATTTFPALVDPLVPAFLGPLVAVGGYVAPFVEIFLSLAFFFSWRVGSFLSIAMHSLILASMVVRSAQMVIWPWQLFIIAIVVQLPRHTFQSKVQQAPILMLVCFGMPLLSWVSTSYPAYAAWNMMGGNTLHALYTVRKQQTFYALPEDIRFFFWPRKDMPWWRFDPQSLALKDAQYLAHSFEYSTYVLTHPTSPERAVFKTFLRFLCKHVNDAADLALFIQHPTHWLIPGSWVPDPEVYTCLSL